MTSPPRYVSTAKKMSGGFSSVDICSDTHLDRLVAIKTIASARDSDRVKDEITALMLLRSKHVVQIFDLLKKADGTIGIVEEYVDGQDLLEYKSWEKPVSTVLLLLWQLASGVADIHAVGVIHRDIKPNNIRVDTSGVLKILDFGLARETKKNDKTDGFVGTFGFAAPELYPKGSGVVKFSQAIDVFAFGATALFMLLGKLPVELARRGPPLELRQDALDAIVSLPMEVRKTIVSCLSLDPNFRPPMSIVRDVMSGYLLRDQHQAIAVLKQRTHTLNARSRNIKLAIQDIGSVSIQYDGLRFNVSAVQGEIAINNKEPTVGMELPGSCVVAIGSIARKPFERAFVTFDVSCPEVIL